MRVWGEGRGGGGNEGVGRGGRREKEREEGERGVGLNNGQTSTVTELIVTLPQWCMPSTCTTTDLSPLKVGGELH